VPVAGRGDPVVRCAHRGGQGSGGLAQVLRRAVAGIEAGTWIDPGGEADGLVYGSKQAENGVSADGSITFDGEREIRAAAPLAASEVTSGGASA
jgi:hypothetical protein